MSLRRHSVTDALEYYVNIGYVNLHVFASRFNDDETYEIHAVNGD